MYKPKLNNKFGVGVIYKLAVMERGRVVREFPWRKNLVMDQGLNLWATNAALSLTQTAMVGTGTTPTKRDSGSVTFTIAGTALVASGNFFLAADVGRLFKFDTGQEYYISAFTDAQNVTVSGAGGTHGPAEGTVWYVNQTALVAQTQSTGTLSGGTGENSGTWNAGDGCWETKRTFLFPTVGAPVTLNEIGWGPSSPAIFGRDLIQPGVSLLTGQQLKATVILRTFNSPIVPTAFTNPFTGGWGDDGDYMTMLFAANNTTTPTYGFFGPQPNNNNLGIWLGTDSVALPANASNVGVIPGGTIDTASLTSAAYVTGSFKRDYTGLFSSGQLVTSGLRSFLFFAPGNPAPIAWKMLLDSGQTKDSLHELHINFRVSWGRILVN